MKSARKSKRLQSLTITNSSDIKKFNRKELQEACRRLNPNRNDIAGEKRQRAQENDLGLQNGGSGAENQVRSLDTGVKICARKYNECKARSDRLEEELGKKRDEITELQREGDVLEDMVKGNNREAKKITKLKRDITDANVKSEGKMRYRLQLNHMHQRQRKNAITVDAHMSEMTSALSSAERERNRCLKMLGEIESGVTSALFELDTISQEIVVEKSKREQSLNNKKIEATNAEKLEQWRNEQESNRRDFEQSLGGTYQLEKESRINLIHEREDELKKLSRDAEAKTSGQGSSEEAFMHIKRATGVNDLAEMVEKLTNHQEQRNRLQCERKDAEDRLKSSKLSFEETQKKFAALKANGIGEDLELNRDVIIGIKAKIEEEQAEGKVLRSINTRLEAVLVGLRQGGMGLYQRILPFHASLLDGDAPILKESATGSVVDLANDTLEMLKTTQQVIGKIVNVIGGVDKVTKSRREKVQIHQESIEKLENPNLGENNCRIQSKVGSNVLVYLMVICINSYVTHCHYCIKSQYFLH
jgi:chromosome segregation ATPase